MIGKKFIRTFSNCFIKEIRIEILDTTRRGYKVRETDIYTSSHKKPKTKIAFYDALDFREGCNLWKEIKNNTK